MFLSHSFHNKLKTTYLNNKVNRRVDFLIDALLRIERDNFFVYMRHKQLFEINYQAIQEAERHARGMKIPPDRVQVTYCMYWGHTYSKIAPPSCIKTYYYLYINFRQWKECGM